VGRGADQSYCILMTSHKLRLRQQNPNGNHGKYRWWF
jgi:hypothetical protein